MTFALTIPSWLLWTLGIAVGVLVLGLAVLGVMFLIAVRDFNRVWSNHFGW